MNFPGFVSVILGVLGVCATGVWTVRRRGPAGQDNPRLYWTVGLLSLFPAWLFAFIGLLPSTAQPDTAFSPPLPVLHAAAAALFAVVITDYAFRRLLASGRVRSALVYWLLGAVSFVPSWLLALNQPLFE